MRITITPGPQDSDYDIVYKAVRCGNVTGKPVSLPLNGAGNCGVFEITPPNFDEDRETIERIVAEWRAACAAARAS